ncbi:MAG: DUF4956 domain-containing protein [Planctomycetia bacterium]
MHVLAALATPDLASGLLRLLVAFLLGAAVAGTRALLRGPVGRDSLAWVLMVLAPLMCLVVGAIEGDLASAFGLVGILALVRFRTPVREPADAVFVLVSVAAGVVVAAESRLPEAVAGVLCVCVLAALAHLLVRRHVRAAPPLEVRLRCAPQALAAVEQALAGAAARVRLVRAELGAAGGPCELRWQVVLRPGSGLPALAQALAAVAGVERVSARDGTRPQP